MARKRASDSGGNGRPWRRVQISRNGQKREPQQGSGPANPSKRRTRGDPDAPLPAGLYLVATPIGNADDITLRALKTLRAAAVIACEDTRTTAKLLAIHGIETSLAAYHEHNAGHAGPVLIERMRAGAAVALVCDAGTPLVSDPGYRLVRACLAADLPVVPIPGASSALAALSVSGLPSDRFLVAGFAPARSRARRRFLETLAAIDTTLILFESPRRLAEALADMEDVLGGAREAAVCRELTKMFESVQRGSLAALSAAYRVSGPPKGEVTLVVAPPPEPAGLSDLDVDKRLAETLARGESVRSAVDEVSRISGRSRRAVYARALDLRRTARASHLR